MAPLKRYQIFIQLAYWGQHLPIVLGGPAILFIVVIAR
jgi:hypothetical protein